MKYLLILVILSFTAISLNAQTFGIQPNPVKETIVAVDKGLNDSKVEFVVNKTIWDGSKWSDGTPTTQSIAIIEANYDTENNGNFVCYSFEVKEGATLNVHENGKIEHISDIKNYGVIDVKGEIVKKEAPKSETQIDEAKKTTIWDGEKWSNGAPDTETKVIIKANYNTEKNGNFDCLEMHIEEKSTVTVHGKGKLVIKNQLYNKGIIVNIGEIVIENN